MWHGSDVELRPGTTLVPGRGMMARRLDDPVEMVLESVRPPDHPARVACVFMVDDPQDVDNCGGNTDWLFEVEPIGLVGRRDASLMSALQCAIEDGAAEEATRLAREYWSGRSGEDPVWETLADAARIVSVERY